MADRNEDRYEAEQDQKREKAEQEQRQRAQVDRDKAARKLDPNAKPDPNIVDTSTGAPATALGQPAVLDSAGKAPAIDPRTGRPISAAQAAPPVVGTGPVTNLGAVRDDLKIVQDMVNELSNRLTILAGRVGI